MRTKLNLVLKCVRVNEF